MRLRFSRPFWLFVVFGSAALYGGDMGSLSRKSPFLPASGSAGPAPTENAPLELRGVLGDGPAAMYNIYDPQRKRSAWVRANEADGRDFVVRAYDTGSQTVQVESGGRTLSLKLSEAKIQPLALNAVPMPAPVMNNGVPAGVAVNPTPADEARRLESVAAEVRRRRALRAAAAQQQAGQAPAQATPNPR